MRVTTVLRRVLAVGELVVEEVRFEGEHLVVAVRPVWRRPRCGGCGRKGPVYDRREERRWRHVALLATRTWLAYAPRRVDCAACGVTTERVPWAEAGSYFTRVLEELVAYLAQVTDKTAASRIAGIAWASVGSIVERVVARRLAEGPRFEGLRRIGIDEFSYRKHHRYVTTVVDHDERRVVWAGEGRGSETLGRFLDELGPAGCAALEHATIDMAAGYIKALRDRVPHVTVVFDRFHVEKLAHDALDEVRRAEVRRLGATPEARAVKGSRFSLLKSPWNLSRRDKDRLADVQQNNVRIYRGYLLKETLAAALEERTPASADRALRGWLAWASRSKLAPFVRVARSVRKHFEGVLGYVRHRFTNGLVEGINNRLRMIARRAYGFHSPGPLIAMLFLCCGGIRVRPPLPTRD